MSSEHQPDPPPTTARQFLRDKGRVAAFGLAGACAAGLALGLLLKPQVDPVRWQGKPWAPVRQVEVPREPDEGLEIVVNTRQATPTPVKAEPIMERTEPPPVRRMAVSRPSFDCRYAASRAEQLVCDDPQLAEADRRLDRAFRQAVEAGAPYRMLRRQQDAWMAAREDAAYDAPEAVADVYEARIAELEEMAY